MLDPFTDKEKEEEGRGEVRCSSHGQVFLRRERSGRDLFFMEIT